MKKIKLAREEDRDQKTLAKQYKRLEIFIIIFMSIAICLGTFYFNVICFGPECEYKSPAPLIIIKTVDKSVDTNTDSGEVAEDSDDLYGTYYNSDYNDVYFVLNNDNTCTVVESSCSDGVLPSKTVACTITESEDTVLLAIDVNNNNKYEEKYTGHKVGDEYHFKPDILGCVDEENTYYSKKQ